MHASILASLFTAYCILRTDHTVHNSMSNMKVLPELSPATTSAVAVAVDRSSGLPEPDEAMLHHEELHSPHKPQPVRRIQVDALLMHTVLLLLNIAHEMMCTTHAVMAALAR
jgi:hypothetical protein